MCVLCVFIIIGGYPVSGNTYNIPNYCCFLPFLLLKLTELFKLGHSLLTRSGGLRLAALSQSSSRVKEGT